MANKTRPNRKSVDKFLRSIEKAEKRDDCIALKALMQDLTDHPAVMWGDSMVGFGRYDYRYQSGHSGSWFLTGFSPRKNDLTIYVMQGFKSYEKQLSKLGKHKHSVSCLYLKRLSDIDLTTLSQIVSGSVSYIRGAYESN